MKMVISNQLYSAEGLNKELMMNKATEKFSVVFTDRGVLIQDIRKRTLKLSAGEALMILDILKNEEYSLREKAKADSPFQINISVTRED